MRWHVLGAGAVGGLWASHLAQAGFPVTLLLKDRQAKIAFEDSPLALEAAGRIERPPADAAVVADFKGRLDWLLVTTKSYATLDALAVLESSLSPATRILLLQNGIGLQQRLAQRYPDSEVIAGITTDGAWRRGPFHVVYAGRGRTRFGAVNRTSSETIGELRHCLERVTLQAEWVDDIWRPLWHKVAINCCINALSAIRGCRNGELLESDEAIATIRGLATEVQQVMAAADLGFAFPQLFDEVIEVIEGTADNYSSMYQDVSRGRETEIDSINGYICARAAELGVAAPLNRALVDAIRAL